MQSGHVIGVPPGIQPLHANAYVTKPVNLTDFERAVRSIDEFFLSIASPVPRA